MDSIDAENLYEERTTVSLARPLLQGDIFAGIAVPGFGDSPLTVQVVTHPCSMRRGIDLNERIQVAPVGLYQPVANWDGHGRVMPLPDLLEDRQHYAAKFVDLTAVAAAELTVDKRIASLSHSGIFVLQQRLVKHSTRVDMAIDLLREQSAPVLAEAELQEIWAELVLGDGVDDLAEVGRAAREFQEWLDQNDKQRRTELQTEVNHASLRREIRAEAARRLDSRPRS